MKTVIYLLLSVVALQSCSVFSDHRVEVTLPKEYEACCGVQPVDYTLGKHSIYVPNVFTPNGDGINDVFKPEHSGFIKISMEIYDRWGEVIYSYDNLNGGWNGTYKGKICQDGYYAYKLYATDNRLKQIEKAGSVLLMK
mgnify:CR=1 FL=1